MEYKQAIYKAREVDIKATAEQLDTHEAVYIPTLPNYRVSAIRTAISRLNKNTSARYSVMQKDNGAIIKREA